MTKRLPSFLTNTSHGALGLTQSGQSAAIGQGPNAFTGNDAGQPGDAPMSITSKILISAFLIGATLPAFAQGTVQSSTQPSVQGSTLSQPQIGMAKKIAPKTASIHKAATTETLRPTTVKPAVTKPDASKTDTMKPEATKTGAAAPVAASPAKPVTKVN